MLIDADAAMLLPARHAIYCCRFTMPLIDALLRRHAMLMPPATLLPIDMPLMLSR